MEICGIRRKRKPVMYLTVVFFVSVRLLSSKRRAKTGFSSAFYRIFFYLSVWYWYFFISTRRGLRRNNAAG
ncbi:hypothetical protein NMA510612_0055 [Neisseria meningitidis]|uniref:Uncharacterized protein n=1 Tax=Neisseria meningitidis TaxID=487 RepID=X5F3B4_NEIME|nr:hypothetical protein NMA510612_0055 [Neisseria meningitidis]